MDQDGIQEPDTSVIGNDVPGILDTVGGDKTVFVDSRAETTVDFSGFELIDDDVPVQTCTEDGGMFCPCEEGSDCNVGWCVETSEGKVCPPVCVEECPSGWTCEQVVVGSDVAWLCLPMHTWLCLPCTTSQDCYAGIPDNGARCLPHGDTGAYCGGTCSSSTDCPSGYSCVQTDSVEGLQSFQCVPNSGECLCNDRFALAGTKTSCVRQNDLGRCQGEWACSSAGMTDCSAPEPAQESCNLKDDDCDGETDEDLNGSECIITTQYGECSGIFACNNGQAVCQGLPAVEEICNGNDDDCDGSVDEGFADTDHDQQADCVDDDDDDDGFADFADCQPLNSAVPSCSGKECGDDGCGGSCGDCILGYACQNGDCVCVPKCDGKECGPDGCGGSCGDCLPGAGCQGGICECIPNCTGKECGDNGCGGSCGDCLVGWGCQGGQCVCSPNCTGKDCGDNGCGGSCGTCPSGFLCQSGICQCIPNCVGKQCGDNGCGGSCGTCAGSYTCAPSGVCQPPNPCGDLTYNGACEDLMTLRVCHEPGNQGLACKNPPYCEVSEVNCMLGCIYSGGVGACECFTGMCDCICLTGE